jgi:hypothetical protein
MRSQCRGEEFILTSKGLGRTIGIESEEFVFVVGGREFKCSVFQAAFISGAVARSLVSDSTINRFEVNVSGSVEGFEEIKRLMKGERININENNYRNLQRLGKVLDNEELVQKCVEHSEQRISVSNCIGKVETKEEFGCEIEEEMKFIAKNFYEVEKEKLKRLKKETLEAILSDEDLCLENEESLVEFIYSLGSEYSNLYGYVECRFLSLEGIEEFLERIEEESIDHRIWGSICRRLRCELSNRELSEHRFIGRRYPYVAGHEFQGIVNALTKKCGGNVHEKGIVNITASSDASNKAFRVANHGWNNYWYSTSQPNSWICFDFKEKRISLEHYTLKSGGDSGQHLVEWEMEGSNDCTTWTTLDKRNTQELNGNYIVKTFECSSENRSKSFRYMRLRQTGRNSSNADYLQLCSIEFFASLE